MSPQLPLCPCAALPVYKGGKRTMCGAPARPVNAVTMECTSGHRFAGTPEEHAQAELAANAGRPRSLLEMFGDIAAKR